MESYLFGLIKVFNTDADVELYLAGGGSPCLFYVKNSDGRKRWGGYQTV